MVNIIKATIKPLYNINIILGRYELSLVKVRSNLTIQTIDTSPHHIK